MTDTMKAAALGATLMLAACGPTAQEQFAKAGTDFAAHRFSAARLELADGLKEIPDDPAALSMLARSQLELGDGEGALATLDRLQALGKAPVDGPVLRGDAELLRGQPAAALTAVSSLDTAEAWRIRALAALRTGNAHKAADAFGKGARGQGPKARLLAESARFSLLNGDRATAARLAALAMVGEPTLEAHLASAELASAAGRRDEALKLYEKASVVWPESRAALVGRIGALGDLGRTAEMAPLLEDAAQRAPDDAALVYMQARLAAASNDWAKARAILQPIEGRMDDIPQGRLLYGQALTRVGQSQQAQAQLKNVLARDPGNRLAQHLMAQARLDSGDTAGALELARPLASRPDAGPQDMLLMAAIARKAGGGDAAQWTDKARLAAGRTLAAQLAVADAAMKRKDWSQAAQAYRRMLAETKGDNAMILNNLAYAESKLGHRIDALAFARRALAVAPANASVLDTAGWIMFESGSDRDQGLALLRKAARLAPANRAIAEHLALASRGTPAPG